jgi:hypothetical protein
MSKKDYVAIAAALREAVDAAGSDGERAGLEFAAGRIAEVCRVAGGFTTNGNRSFDRERFMVACGFPAAS